MFAHVVVQDAAAESHMQRLYLLQPVWFDANTLQEKPHVRVLIDHAHIGWNVHSNVLPIFRHVRVHFWFMRSHMHPGSAEQALW